MVPYPAVALARPFVSMRVRRRAAALAACALAVALEVYLVAVCPFGRTAAHGRGEILLTAFGDGVPIAQEFSAGSDALREIRVTVDARQPASLELHWRLSQLADGGWRELRVGAVALTRLEGARVVRLGFAPVDHSAGTAFLLELTARPAPVALVATRDKPLRFSYLTVGGREQWGDLVFDTRADADTLWGRLRAIPVPRVAAALRDPLVFAPAAIVLFNGLAILFLQQMLRAERDLLSTHRPPRNAGAYRTPVARVSAAGAAVVLVVASAGCVWAGVSTHGAYDLYAHLDEATLRTTWPLHDAFDRVALQIGWSRRRAIRATAPSVMSWRLTVPAHARLRTSLALDPDAWDRSGDGVVFLVRAVHGGATTALLTRTVDPRHVPADRQWIPIDVDLSRFAGQSIALELVTEASLPGRPQDAGYDWAVWGAPRIVDSRLFAFDPDRLTAVN